nr:DUF2127 domain-containing protein [Chlorobium sp. KB01]
MKLKIEIKKGLRALAIFEAAKGVLILLAGLSVFSLLHQNIQIVAEQLIAHAHFSPAKNSPKIFIEAAGNLTDGRICALLKPAACGLPGAGPNGLPF